MSQAGNQLLVNGAVYRPGSPGPTCSSGRLRQVFKKGELAHDHVLDHDPVTGEAVERMFKRGRPIILKEEVTDPRRSISSNKTYPDIRPCSCPRHVGKKAYNCRASSEVA